MVLYFVSLQELQESGEIIPTGPDASRPQHRASKFSKPQSD